MPVSRPSPEDLTRTTAEYHFTIPPERMAAVAALVEGFLAPYDELDATDEPRPPVRYPRAAVLRPAPEDNPLGAWHVRIRRATNSQCQSSSHTDSFGKSSGVSAILSRQCRGWQTGNCDARN